MNAFRFGLGRFRETRRAVCDGIIRALGGYTRKDHEYGQAKAYTNGYNQGQSTVLERWSVWLSMREAWAHEHKQNVTMLRKKREELGAEYLSLMGRPIDA